MASFGCCVNSCSSKFRRSRMVSLPRLHDKAMWKKKGERSRAVCIEPYREMVNQRVSEWRKKFNGVKGGKETGETSADLRLLEPGDVIVCTPTQVLHVIATLKLTWLTHWCSGTPFRADGDKERIYRRLLTLSRTTSSWLEVKSARHMRSSSRERGTSLHSRRSRRALLRALVYHSQMRVILASG